MEEFISTKGKTNLRLSGVKVRKNCIFCQIVEGTAPAHIIYQDSDVVAFLDISNDIEGHTLVVPRNHVKNCMDCDPLVLCKVIEACKKIGDHYVKNCGFAGYNIINASGKWAEQTVPHLHFHILPRKQGDHQKVYPKLEGCYKELKDICEKLKLPLEENNIPVSDKDCVVLYTDGACSGNPGPGGWAAIMSYKGKEKVISGGVEDTTNNRMELYAVIMGLESIKKNIKIKVYSDSAYVINSFQQKWIDKWRKKSWRTSNNQPVLNKELWQRLLRAISGKDVEFNKVKGHSDVQKNIRCDELARNEIRKIEEELT